MASRSAMVLVIFIVSVLAFCFAGAFAAMTGTYHLNLDFGNKTNDTSFFGNATEFNSDKSSSSSKGSVQTSSDRSSSNVETKEDTNPSPSPTPSPTPTPSPEPSPTPTPTSTNRTAKVV